MKTYTGTYTIDTYDIEVLGADEEGLNIAINNNKDRSITIITYIPCGDKRYDYKIFLKGKMDITTIEELLDKFTEMVVKWYKNFYGQFLFGT